VFSRPASLPDACLHDALRDEWGFAATTLAYQPVGFGSHHWLAADVNDEQLFVTVDDLEAGLRSAADTTDAVYVRLERAFVTALSLRRDAGLPFVVAPVPTRAGRVLARLTSRYSIVVHRFVDGQQAGREAEFDRPADRHRVVEMLTALHAAQAEAPLDDDFVVPKLAELTEALADTAGHWRGGPYGQRARDLLATHAADLAVLVTVRADLADRVAARSGRNVITHGEPNAANMLRTQAGLMLVDWESVLLAPPERDLWALSDSDPSIPAAYAAATGLTVDADALTLYRLSYDIGEIALYISQFRRDHGETADTAEAWRNLEHFLRPRQRWPAFFPPGDSPGRSL
jgi:aminoglycoside phosphotransferase (APT) family kinase protein